MSTTILLLHDSDIDVSILHDKCLIQTEGGPLIHIDLSAAQKLVKQLQGAIDVIEKYKSNHANLSVH